MPSIWTGSVPFTCEIGYQADHVGSDEFVELIRKARPGLAHVGQDTPLSSWMGDTVQFLPKRVVYVSAEEIPARIQDLRAYVRRLHEAGARQVIPYICTMLMVGNPKTREGFWHLYDRWDEFRQYGLGPKPHEDPVEWSQSKPRPLPENPEGFSVYEPSINHPGWRQFLRACTDLAAQCGYDGAFLDVNSYCGYLECDRLAFVEYLRERYTDEELRNHFGFASSDEVRLGKQGDGGLLWVETQRFRAWAMGKLYAELRDVGRKHVPDFWVYPNLSPLGTIDAFYKRRSIGHGLTYSHDPCRYVMFEEMLQPGRLGMDRVNDHILQYRYALSHGAGATALPYQANDLTGIALANAECAANGGSTFVQCNFTGTETIRFWNDWYQRHADKYDGLESVHDVGVLFFFDQAYWDTEVHIDSVYGIRQALSDNHVLFDFIVEAHISPEILRSFRVVVVPAVRYLSAREMDLLVTYVADGGRLVVIGDCGTYDEPGRRLSASLRERIAPFWERVVSVNHSETLIPARKPELYDLLEDEINDFDTVIKLPDRVCSPAEAQAARKVPLVPVLERLVGRRLRVLADGAPYTLRVSLFRDPKREARLVAHLVNYDVPVLGGSKSGEPIPARDVRLLVPSKTARWWTTDGVEGGKLTVDEGGVTVPEVRLYALVEMTTA